MNCFCFLFFGLVFGPVNVRETCVCPVGWTVILLTCVEAPLVQEHCRHLFAHGLACQAYRWHVVVLLQRPVRQLRHRAPHIPPPVPQRRKRCIVCRNRGQAVIAGAAVFGLVVVIDAEPCLVGQPAFDQQGTRRSIYLTHTDHREHASSRGAHL